MSSIKTTSKRAVKDAVEELCQGSENTETSSEFEDVFDVDYFAHRQRVVRKLSGLELPSIRDHYRLNVNNRMG